MEQVASKKREFWAREFLLKRLWDAVKRRRDLARWSREIIISNFNKVTIMRELILDVVDKEIGGRIEAENNRETKKRLQQAEEKKRSYRGSLPMEVEEDLVAKERNA